MPATSVKTFYSLNVGAPTISGLAGSLIGVLDACLKDGYGLITLSSLVVASGVATATTASPHGFLLNQVATLAGATPSGLNGDFRLTVVSATTFKFACPGVTDGAASGTITAKITPLGWTKPFSGTNLAAYKPSDPLATGMYLRVDDTNNRGTGSAAVWGCEVMTDINSYTGAFPTAVQQVGGLWWTRATDNTSTARAWIIFGDERCFYLYLVPYNSAPTGGVLSFFGDILQQGSTDQYHCVIAGGPGTFYGSGQVTPSCLGASASTGGSGTGIYLARSWTQIGGAVGCPRGASVAAGSTVYSMGNGGYTSFPLSYWPNPADNAMMILPVLAYETSAGLRGAFPGLYHCPQSATGAYTSLNHLDQVPATDVAPGKLVLTLKVGCPALISSYFGQCFLDPIGPWRS
ncbi:MAG: hypothetical protein ACRERX_16930 [Pseudomonas sp.]